VCSSDLDNDLDGLRSTVAGAIKAIRAYDRKHIILIPSDQWNHSRALEPTWGKYLETRGNPDPQRNAVFAFHDYPRDNDPPIVKANVSAFVSKHNVPVLCTEYGTAPQLSEAANRDFQRGLLAVCSSLKIGWLNWDVTWGSRWPKMNGWPYEDVWAPVVKASASAMPVPNSPAAYQDR
jgi:hypothetical protein